MHDAKQSNRLHWGRITASLILILSLIAFGFVTSSELKTELTSSPSMLPTLSAKTQVLTYVGKVDWEPITLGELKQGQEFQFDSQLYYLDGSGIAWVKPDIDVKLLAEADRAFEEDSARFPKSRDVVRFIAKDGTHLRHDLMGTTRAGDQFFYQGQLYETVSDSNSVTGLSIKKTEIILSYVTNTFNRQADTLIDLTIVDASGKEWVITGTPEHPFFVPSENDYISMGELVPGMVLKTMDGSLATVSASSVRQENATVYNLEVAGTNNYFISSTDGGPAVNVHNQCGTGLNWRDGK